MLTEKMADVSSESPLDLKTVLAILETDTSSDEQVLEAYSQLIRHMSKELSLFERDFVEHGRRLIAITKKHVTANGELKNSITPKALNVMGFCVNSKNIVSLLTAVEMVELVSIWNKIIAETKEKNTCTYAFWCLSNQAFPSYIMCSELSGLVNTFSRAAVSWWDTSNMVENAAMIAIQRLGIQCPKEMKALCPKWGPPYLRLLVSQSGQTREHALGKIQKWAVFLASSGDFLRAGISTVTKQIVPTLIKMFTNGMEVFALKTCTLLIQIFKQEIQNILLINSLLSVQEQAFRCPNSEVRCQAFQSWGIFIDILNDKGILQKAKFVELIMRVFKTRNTNIEQVAVAKLNTWWHYVLLLGPTIWSQFNQIVRPLLQFCLGNTRLGVDSSPSLRVIHDACGEAAQVPMTFSSPGTAVELPTFPKTQQGGLVILTYLFQDPEHPAAFFDLEPLKKDNSMPLDVCIKNARFLVSAMAEFSKLFGATKEAQVLFVWERMTAYIMAAVKNDKDESSTAVSSFLSKFQTLIEASVLKGTMTMKLFQLICSLPDDVLSSPSLVDGSLFKCRAHSLCELLLLSSALSECGDQERFVTLFMTLVKYGTKHNGGSLSFLESMGKLLDNQAGVMPSAQTLWRLWSFVANTVHQCISATNQVDQDDDLWPNFSCLYTVLLLPISHLMGPKLPQTVHKRAFKTLTELYQTFARLAAMVTTAEANMVVEDFSQKIITKISVDTYAKDPHTLEHLVDVCKTIVKSIDFSSLMSANPFMKGIRTTPSSAMHRQLPKPMGNLHSIVTLLTHLTGWVMERMHSEGVDKPPAAKQKNSGGIVKLGSCCSKLMDIFSLLVTSVTVSSLISHIVEILTPSLAALFMAIPKKLPTKVCTVAFTHKLDRLWQEVCHMLCMHYKGQYDSDMLHQMEPLLHATFLHPRRVIKNHTVQFWNATFGAGAGPLTYPFKLQGVLVKMQEKTQLSLPGWVATDVAFIEETPVSQMSQMDSQAPEPLLPGMPSPVRPRGSFLHRDVSPKSATKSISPKPVQPLSENRSVLSARKRLPLESMSHKMDSQAPEPLLPGMPSPVHPRGSFLHRDVSPKSATKSISPKPVQPLSENRRSVLSARKKLPLESMSHKDFVVITGTPNKQRVLTEHQKEVLREKRVLPAMYNNLEASQDISLMAHFSSDATQQDTFFDKPTIDDVIVVKSGQSQDPLEQKQVNNDQEEKSGVLKVPITRQRTRSSTVRFNVLQSSKEDNQTSEESVKVTEKRTEIASILDNSSLNTKDGQTTEMPTAAAEENPQIISVSESSSEEREKKCEQAALKLPTLQPSETADSTEKLVDPPISQNTPQLAAPLSSEPSDEKHSPGVEVRVRSVSQKTSCKNPLYRNGRGVASKKQGACSQEFRGSKKLTQAEHKPTKDPYTTLKNWLRKQDADQQMKKEQSGCSAAELVTDKQTISSKSKDIGDSGSVIVKSDGQTSMSSQPENQQSGILAEETRSPQDTAKEIPISITAVKETPTKTSSLKMSLPKGLNSRCTRNCAVELPVPPVLNFSKNHEVTAHGTPLPSPMEHLPAQIPRFSLQPPVVCEEIASQGFPLVTQDRQSYLQFRRRKTTRKKCDSEDSTSNSHQEANTLLEKYSELGFSGLLRQTLDQESVHKGELDTCPKEDEAVNGDVGSPVDLRSGHDSELETCPKEIMTMSGDVLAPEQEAYDPQLLATLRSTPLPRRSSRFQSSELSDASDNQKSAVGDDRDEIMSQSFQKDVQLDTLATFDTYDPTKDSTLNTTSEHLRKRKQQTPKRIADPMALRRTPRIISQKKSVCGCFTVKPGNNHMPDCSNPTKKLCHKDRHLKSLLGGISPRLRLLRKKKIEASPSSFKDAVNDIVSYESKADSLKNKTQSLQGLCEVTPENKTTSTALRQSTTERKKIVARQKSASKSLQPVLDKVLESDSESSHFASQSHGKTPKWKKDVFNSKKEQERNQNVQTTCPADSQSFAALLESPVKTALNNATPELGTKISTLQKFGARVQSPPNLHLRRKKSALSDKICDEGQALDTGTKQKMAVNNVEYTGAKERRVVKSDHQSPVENQVKADSGREFQLSLRSRGKRRSNNEDRTKMATQKKKGPTTRQSLLTLAARSLAINHRMWPKRHTKQIAHGTKQSLELKARLRKTISEQYEEVSEENLMKDCDSSLSSNDETTGGKAKEGQSPDGEGKNEHKRSHLQDGELQNNSQESQLADSESNSRLHESQLHAGENEEPKVLSMDGETDTSGTHMSGSQCFSPMFNTVHVMADSSETADSGNRMVKDVICADMLNTDESHEPQAEQSAQQSEDLFDDTHVEDSSKESATMCSPVDQCGGLGLEAAAGWGCMFVTDSEEDMLQVIVPFSSNSDTSVTENMDSEECSESDLPHNQRGLEMEDSLTPAEVKDGIDEMTQEQDQNGNLDDAGQEEKTEITNIKPGNRTEEDHARIANYQEEVSCNHTAIDKSTQTSPEEKTSKSTTRMVSKAELFMLIDQSEVTAQEIIEYLQNREKNKQSSHSSSECPPECLGVPEDHYEVEHVLKDDDEEGKTQGHVSSLHSISGAEDALGISRTNYDEVDSQKTTDSETKSSPHSSPVSSCSGPFLSATRLFDSCTPQKCNLSVDIVSDVDSLDDVHQLDVECSIDSGQMTNGKSQESTSECSGDFSAKHQSGQDITLVQVQAAITSAHADSKCKTACHLEFSPVQHSSSSTPEIKKRFCQSHTSFDDDIQEVIECSEDCTVSAGVVASPEQSPNASVPFNMAATTPRIPPTPTSGILKRGRDDNANSKDDFTPPPKKMRHVSFPNPVEIGGTPTCRKCAGVPSCEQCVDPEAEEYRQRFRAAYQRMMEKKEERKKLEEKGKKVENRLSTRRRILLDVSDFTKPSTSWAGESSSSNAWPSSTGGCPSMDTQNSGTPSQQNSDNSYHSTQNTPLGSDDSIFPQLVDCNDSLESIVPSLTSTSWSRGLRSLLLGRGLKTVGHLAALTERQVEELPFNHPKTKTLRTALIKYHEKCTSKSSDQPSLFGALCQGIPTSYFYKKKDRKPHEGGGRRVKTSDRDDNEHEQDKPSDE